MNETIVLGSQSQHQPSASNKMKRKTLGSSKNNVESSNVIDVDDYDYDDVIVIDFPALYPQRVRKSRSIVCIDDENDGIDVEFEESSGKLQEQWEKAFSRRRIEVCLASFYSSLWLVTRLLEIYCSLFSILILLSANMITIQLEIYCSLSSLGGKSTRAAAISKEKRCGDFSFARHRKKENPAYRRSAWDTKAGLNIFPRISASCAMFDYLCDLLIGLYVSCMCQ